MSISLDVCSSTLKRVCCCVPAGDLLLVLCMTMMAAVLSASFAVFLVRERENNSKQVQVSPVLVPEHELK